MRAGWNNLARNVELGSGGVVAFNFNVTLHGNIYKTTFYQHFSFFLCQFIFLVASSTFFIIIGLTREFTVALAHYYQEKAEPTDNAAVNIRNNEIYKFSLCNQRTMEEPCHILAMLSQFALMIHSTSMFN